MDENRFSPASPAAGAPLNALNAMSPNQQRFDLEGSVKTRLFDQDSPRRDSTVQERAARFDQLANSGRSQQQKSMEASLKRAMVGLEEAEKLKKKYLAEATAAKMETQLMEAKVKKVAHRHEEAIEYISRLKESHARTQETLSKDIQKYRKNSNAHALMVKTLQDKYNASKTDFNRANADLDREREKSMAVEAQLIQERQRSAAREQEAFESRSQLSTLQEELAAANEKIKVAEQERNAFKAAAKSEEVARIAAEGRIPLPKTMEDEEFGSPKKAAAPLPKVEVVSSEASEEEIEQLKEDLAAARYHVDTAYDLIAYMNLECQFNCCSCRSSTKTTISLTNEPRPLASRPVKAAPISSPESDIDMMEDVEMGGVEHDAMDIDTTVAAPLRTSTIFVPAEGIFRTVPSRSQQQQSQTPSQPPPKSYRTSEEQMPPPSLFINRESTSSRPSRQSPINSTFPHRQARTPSVEPPTFANNGMRSTDASILSFAGGAPNNAPQTPGDNQPSIFEQHQEFREEQHQQQQVDSRKENDGREERREERREEKREQQQSQQNVNPFQHHLHQQFDPVHSADLAAGKYVQYSSRARAQNEDMGEQSQEGREKNQSDFHGKEEGEHEPAELVNSVFGHHLHGQNEPVRRVGEKPVLAQKIPVFASQPFMHNVRSQNENPAFGHHVHNPQARINEGDNPVFRHHVHLQNEPVRKEDVVMGEVAMEDYIPRESHRERRPMAPPPKPSRENERPQHQQSSHRLNRHSSAHKQESRERETQEHREHNFRTISTTSTIKIRDEDDEPISASAVHHSSSFGLERQNSTLSTLSTLSEPSPGIYGSNSGKSITGDGLPVSREEALAMIRERRGRARSMHQDDKRDDGRGKTRPPTRQEAPKTPRRDISVGTVKSTSQRNARSVSRGRLHGL